MSHHDDPRDAAGAPGATPRLDEPHEGKRRAFDDAADASQLQRALLIYGTTGDAGRAGRHTRRASDLH